MALYKADKARVADFTPEARRFLNRIRRGMGDRQAASEAGVTMTTVRVWLRDAAFSEHYEAAKAGKGGARVVNLATVDGDYPDVERARQQIASLGYETDSYGVLTGGWRGFVDRLRNG